MLAGNEILMAREERVQQIRDFSENNVVVVIKANIPGANKQTKESYVLTRLFAKVITNKFSSVAQSFFDSKDGPIYMFRFADVSAIDLKKQMISIEENHELGRLIDLDVYDETLKNISRQDLEYNLRKCLVCDEDAFVCIRSKAHSFKEINNHISTLVMTYLQKSINELNWRSFLMELNIHPKFGLVTPFSQGSHQDMDYPLMVKAIQAILPGFIELFTIGFTSDCLDVAFSKGRRVGLAIEEQMFIATENVNAYKGAIFIHGLVMLSLGYLLQQNQEYTDLFNNIAYMTRDILNEFLSTDETSGVKIYKKFGLGGARSEAHRGLFHVQKAIKMLNSFNELSLEALLMTLIFLISNCDDTVMIKRSGCLSKYSNFKTLVSSIDSFDYQKITEVTNTYIEGNISCGGSADLLISSIFIKLLFDELLG